MNNKLFWKPGTLLAPVPVVMVGCGGGKRRNNIITVAWTGIVCSDPAMLSVSIRPSRYSYALIEESGEFTVNLPDLKLADAVDSCGVVSGRDVDKFAKFNLTAVTASQVRAPLVGECPLSLECRVRQKLDLGSHAMFLADILAVAVSEDHLNEDGSFDLARAGLLTYAHGNYYELGKFIGRFGHSVKRAK